MSSRPINQKKIQKKLWTVVLCLFECGAVVFIVGALALLTGIILLIIKKINTSLLQSVFLIDDGFLMREERDQSDIGVR